MDLSAWLRNLGLGQYEQAFRDNAIGPDVLLQLTAEDLKELGVDPCGPPPQIARRDCRLARLRLARVR